MHMASCTLGSGGSSNGVIGEGEAMSRHTGPD